MCFPVGLSINCMVCSMAESNFRILLSTLFNALKTCGLCMRVELESTLTLAVGQNLLRSAIVSSMIPSKSL